MKRHNKPQRSTRVRSRRIFSHSEYPVFVTCLALLEYVGFVMLAGDARRRSGIAAPATTGDERLERALRVQHNTLEQLIVFLPSLWLYALYHGGRSAAAIGLVFVVGRAWYALGYLHDPARRGPGFLLGFLATVVLLIGALLGAARGILAQ